VRAGRGFTYRDADGATLTDPEVLDRIHKLVIPPAWTDVWICPYPNGHIQATGVDAAGRRQYLYHPKWREQKDRAKFERMLELAESLPTARRGVTIDLRSEGPTRRRVLAAAFRMLDHGSLRVGSERYAEQHGSHGLSTLLCSHATISGDRISLAFPGKSGQDWDSEFDDADLAALLRTLKRRGPNARLLAFKDERGWYPLDAEEINEDVRERTGGDFTSKDFRTLHGSIAAAVSLARTGPQRTPTARKRAETAAVRDASEVLGNTPSVARGSYVDPRILDHYDHGRTIDPARLDSAESELRALLYS
jgi:DNA topoisomerase-1